MVYKNHNITLSTIDAITSGFFRMCCPIPLLNIKPVKQTVLFAKHEQPS